MSSIYDWVTTAASNATSDTLITLSGSTDSIRTADNNMRQIMGRLAEVFTTATIASATTTDLASDNAQAITISGTTTITGLGTLKAGAVKFITFSGALTLTHNGTSLILPGGANITTAAGDCALAVSLGSGNWRVMHYTRATATGAGDVVGPASSVDNTIPRFDSTTGKLLQTSTVSIDDTGSITLADTDVSLVLKPTSTGIAALEIGTGRSGDGNTYIDLVGDATYTDYGLRILRSPTANGNSQMNHRGTGTLYLTTQEAAAVIFQTNSTTALTIDGTTQSTTLYAPLFITEQASADADVAGDGQIWVKNTSPAELWYTDDVGTDFQISGATHGQHTIWVPASEMEPRTGSSPAASNFVLIGTSNMALRTMDFDTAAYEYCGFAVQMPKSWDAGTVIAQFVWSTTGAQTAGLDGARWAISGGSYGDSDVLTAALGAAVGIGQDHSGTANDVMITPETTGFTIANAAAEEWVYFEIYRYTDHFTDDLDIDARLHGVKIHYTTNAGTDD